MKNATTTPKTPTTAPCLHNVRATARPQFGAYCMPVASGAAPAADPRTPRGGAFGRQLAQAATAPARSHHSPHRQPKYSFWSRPSDVYDGAELAPYTGRPGAMHAHALPSRMGNQLHYRDGRVETMKG